MTYTDNRKAVICSQCNERPRKNNSAWCRECYIDYRKSRVHHYWNVLRRYKTIKGCRVCGYNTCAAALQFNHLDPLTKKDRQQLGKLIKSGGSWERIKDEIKQCEVLCANCHAEHSYNKKHHLLGDCSER